MYKVLVVDDEEMICSGIKSLIEYIDIPEINEVIMAFSGHEAEKLVRKVNPDIVITDMRMPGTSGLELIKTLIDYDEYIRFIVLSGYDDFNYVKESFKLGVKDYILKPASTKELKQVIIKVIGEIEKQKQQLRAEQEMTYRYHRAILENNLNRIFLNSYMDIEAAEKILADINVEFPYESFLVGMFEFTYSPFNASIDTQLEYIFDANNLFTTQFSGIMIYSFLNYKGNLVVLFNFDQNWGYQKLRSLLYDLAQKLQDNKGYKFFVAISQIGQGLEGLYSVYRQCMESLRYKILFSLGEIIEYSSITKRTGRCTLLEADVREFCRQIISLETEVSSNFVDSLFNKESLKDQSIDSIKRVYETLVHAIQSVAGGFEGENHAINKFDDFRSLMDIRIYIKEQINKTFEFLKGQWQDKYIVETVQKYIYDNLDKEINMAVAANMVGMSYSYFSKIFKEETGMNFSEYVTCIRMEKAREMLDKTVIKIHEVSEKVGYKNPKHFTRAFKNYFGISPKEYKDGYWVKKHIEK